MADRGRASHMAAKACSTTIKSKTDRRHPPFAGDIASFN